MSHRGSYIDQLLAEAVKKGIYDPDRAGAGALEFPDTAHVDPADRVGYHLLHCNGFLPPVLEERSALLREHCALAQTLAAVRALYPSIPPYRRDALLLECRDTLTDIWRRTLDFNLTAALPLQIAGIRVEYELEQIRATLTPPTAF